MTISFVLGRFKPKYLGQVININKNCLPENYSDSFFMRLYERFPETFIVALVNDLVIGYIMCRIESGIFNVNFRNLSVSKKGHVISIAVSPRYRSEGIGSALLKEVLRTMKVYYGAGKCYLEVRVSNSNAIRLYRKVGFIVEKTIRGYYSDGENAHIMSRKI
jgi:ribosomal-protein-alanine N-acetyltransferase